MTGDLDAEQIGLLAHDAEWAAAASEGADIEKILSYWTDDAIVIPPGLAVFRGKPAIRNYVQGTLGIPGFSINWMSDDVTISADGTLTHMIGSNRVTMQSQDGSPIVLDGRVMTIWRRDGPENEWRCAVDIWNAAE
jgi:ketosteroid isomerase-like protein